MEGNKWHSLSGVKASEALTAGVLVGVFPRSVDFESFWGVPEATLMRVKSDPMERRMPHVDMSLWLLSEKTNHASVTVSTDNDRNISGGTELEVFKSF